MTFHPGMATIEPCHECEKAVTHLEAIVEEGRLYGLNGPVSFRDMDRVIGWIVKPCGHFANGWTMSSDDPVIHLEMVPDLERRKPMKFFRTSSCHWCGFLRREHLGLYGTGPCPRASNCSRFADRPVTRQDADLRLRVDGYPRIGWPQG